MRICRVAPAAVLIALALSQALPTRAADFDFARYPESTLADVVARGKQVRVEVDESRVGGKLVFQHDTRYPPYRLQVTWTGESRPLTDNARECLEYGRDEASAVAHLFIREVRVVAAEGESSWMPIQETLYADWVGEVGEGGGVVVYVTLFAFIDGVPVMTINEFQALALAGKA
ncbi:MAG: hypothetical protein ACREO7_12540 [Pseudoxanthomonas sp.]